MQHGSSLWLSCLVTTWFLAGYGESFGQKAGQAPPPAIAPFGAAQAKVHQKAWADYLGVPVESRNSIGMMMVLIPPGEFTMGSPESEPKQSDDEAQHIVALSKAFSLGGHEVTQSQYEQVMGDNPSKFKGANNPVEMVSRDNAVSFCEKLSALPDEVAAGRVYRLPTEAEWEYACRAGTTTAFSFGDDEQDLGKYAWFAANSGPTTHAVGEKLPNGWGLYDMHGNVWEWCSVKYYPRVPRGGGWDFGAAFCRSASRATITSNVRAGDLGFRVALSSPSGQSTEAEEGKGSEPAGVGKEGARR